MLTTLRFKNSTRVSPFRALYGRDPRLPPDPQVVKIHTNHTDATSWWLYLQSNIPLLRRALQYNLNKAQQRQKKHFDATHKPGELEIGDQVRVYYPIRRKGLSLLCIVGSVLIRSHTASGLIPIDYGEWIRHPRLLHTFHGLKRYLDQACRPFHRS